MRILLLLVWSLGLSQWSMAQSSATHTIRDIQFRNPQDLGNCKDLSPLFEDTVTIHASVVMDGGMAQAAFGRNLWLQDTLGPWGGLNLHTTGVPIPVTGIDVLDLIQGDSIEINGIIRKFGHETIITPLKIQLLVPGRTIIPNPIDIAALNGPVENRPQTGEQWEGAYVELNNLVVDAHLYSSNQNRINLRLRDELGNTLIVGDRFPVLNLPINGGTFTPPPIGTTLSYIRGVISHAANGCFGGTGQGYMLFPFDENDWAVQTAPPIISQVIRHPAIPSSTDSVRFSAQIEDPDGQVQHAFLHIRKGVNGTNWQVLPMHPQGPIYRATISSSQLNDGDRFQYYISAMDDDSTLSYYPTNGLTQPAIFTVRDGGLIIPDLQYTPYMDGNSPYLGQQVTVHGIVTATDLPGDLGKIYMQDPLATSWAGISISGTATIETVQRGDHIQVTGMVAERGGRTELIGVTNLHIISTGNPIPNPTIAAPDQFSIYNGTTTEPYESMLITLRHPQGQSLYVNDPNPDSNNGNNFGEYRVGLNPALSTIGCRILAGRTTSDDIVSSLYVSFVNDSAWVFESGELQVPACIVALGDTLEEITGIMTYDFGNMKLLPRNNADVIAYRGANCLDGSVSVEKPIRSNWNLYPNPAERIVHLSGWEAGAPLTLEVFDLAGGKVLQRDIPAHQTDFRWDISELASGTYVLRMGPEYLPKKLVIIR
ncbi:T9SS type A sorting domain-containing protein [Pontibacter sp. G13]|uniref:T9SS type A sorting domain-containing protein n=1 Tax=Pontibacter sp. G13 TaxID=3074898 RepID=UPI00288C0AEF|nr:T9SS type A sorting domain-containing protein [Pontibacter sp. G13]WNJ16686.1 T9SS type A sorting domain-containing protein [Pontibacter sp. G13]